MTAKAVHYVYTHKTTGEKYLIGDLQNKYQLGFAESSLWRIIEQQYTANLELQEDWKNYKDSIELED